VERDKLDKTYMNMAKELAKLSHAQRRKVGCLIVKDTHIIAEGLNGTPRGFDNNCEYIDHVDHMYTKPEVLHAESNAITKLARSTNSSSGATVYVTCSPCYDCSKLIIQAGIKRVVYAEPYSKGEGITLLKKAGIEVEKL
jgi:dCMP deaminase